MQVFGAGIEHSVVERHPVERAAAEMDEGLLVYDNFAVYALAGNANNEDLQERIRIAKGEARGVKQPVGWTHPFDERTLGTIDLSRLDDSALRNLLRSPEELTARIGALTFIRAHADMKAKEVEGIPDSIIPPGGGTVQIYSPVGTTRTERLITQAIMSGFEPVMTSANVSGEPEIIFESTAAAFAAQSPEPLVVAVNKSDEDKPERPRGSYPVISVLPDRLRIVRSGCFDPQILQTALSGYPVELASDCQVPKYPDNVLQFSDLPTDVQYLKGSEFRLGVLEFLGWGE
jgi:tRNA A37 threonylcarbamoyladenosine synthetase subunit TsaC/SUA5/YrdC